MKRENNAKRKKKDASKKEKEENEDGKRNEYRYIKEGYKKEYSTYRGK